MKSDANSCLRYFILLLIAFLIAIYQIHIFKTEFYAPVFSNSSDNF